MDDNNFTRKYQEEEEEEEEETLSLSDLPLTAEDEHDSAGENHSELSDRRTSSEPTAFFEFLSDLNSEMSHAEDIILGGKLRPFNDQPFSNQTHKPLAHKDDKTQILHSRRCGSMSELKTTRPDITKTGVMRNSRSLDYQKLRRTSSSSSLVSDHNWSSGKCGGPGQKASKPRWYVLMFGFVKFPPEMHLRDIRNRQVRRSPAGLLPSFEAGGKVRISQSDRRKSSWGLLRVLSCKGHASVAVTASFEVHVTNHVIPTRDT